MSRSSVMPAAIAALLLASPSASAYTGMPTGTENPPSVNPAFEQELVELVNAARVTEGKAPLKRIDCLDRAARYHTNDMMQDGYFSHDTQDAGGIFVCNWSQRLGVFCPGISPAGDLIGNGFQTPADMVNAWLGSELHRQVIMMAGIREMGAGYCPGASSARFWVVDFGLHSSVYPIVIEEEDDITTTPVVSVYVHGAGTWTEMRFKNDGEDWGSWVPFASTTTWELRHQSGTRTVYAEMRNASNSTQSEDTIDLEMPVAVYGSEHDGTRLHAQLEPARPNPCFRSTVIAYWLPRDGVVMLRIHDVAGRQVRTFARGHQARGVHEVIWDGCDDSSRRLPAGIYFCTLKTPETIERRSIVLFQ